MNECDHIVGIDKVGIVRKDPVYELVYKHHGPIPNYKIFVFCPECGAKLDERV